MPIWGYKKTGFLQIIEPKIIIRKAGRNNAYITAVLDKSRSVAQAKRERRSEWHTILLSLDT